MTRQDTNAIAALPVPDPNGLVIRSTQNPRVFMMKHGSADVVQVAKKSENTSSLLVVPHLNFVVISS